MRDNYYKFLNKTGIINYLDNIEELSYSKKFIILENLYKEFNVEQINKALVMYKKRYIDIGRVNLLSLKNILKGMCNLFKEE